MTIKVKRQLNDGPNIRREKEIVSKMIYIYCKKKHNQKVFCEECQDLNDYAWKRLSLCPFGEEKAACAKCSIHCYKQDYRERIKIIMRFSGPWMLLYHPIESIRHFRIPGKLRK
ncbi:nitrous oxide-stimulated promoter family protein [Paenibacillus wynnii]|uniref:nitrous oxide-stimulated promoter family protein n=1 Tax=Paenibacillus wynnii TaxID=268407 RepID=UPI00278EB93F|nr:nitrous oxide-stimulated promoter family protein [Paenibacillus wynnii]MDQ0195270.1 putative paraquat-inducible protein A [Paenibacillus wynnii]